MTVTPEVLAAHYNALPILIEGVKLLPAAQRAEILKQWDLARAVPPAPPAFKHLADLLADAIEASTIELVVHVPNTDYYARDGEPEKRTITFVDGAALAALLRE